MYYWMWSLRHTWRQHKTASISKAVRAGVDCPGWRSSKYCAALEDSFQPLWMPTKWRQVSTLLLCLQQVGCSSLVGQIVQWSGHSNAAVTPWSCCSFATYANRRLQTHCGVSWFWGEWAWANLREKPAFGRECSRICPVEDSLSLWRRLQGAHAESVPQLCVDGAQRSNSTYAAVMSLVNYHIHLLSQLWNICAQILLIVMHVLMMNRFKCVLYMWWCSAVLEITFPDACN